MDFKKAVKVGFALKGGNQQDVAKLIQVAAPTFSNWMNGKTQPNLQDLKNIAVYFDVSLSIFILWGE